MLSLLPHRERHHYPWLQEHHCLPPTDLQLVQQPHIQRRRRAPVFVGRRTLCRACPWPRTAPRACCGIRYVKDLCNRGCGEQRRRASLLLLRTTPTTSSLTFPDPSFSARRSTKAVASQRVRATGGWRTQHRIAERESQQLHACKRGSSCAAATVATHTVLCSLSPLLPEKGSAPRRRRYASSHRASPSMAAWGQQQQLGSPGCKGTHAPGRAAGPAGDPRSDADTIMLLHPACQVDAAQSR